MSGYEYPQFTGAVGGGGVAISAVGQSVSSGTVTFANSNGVSFGMAGSVITATVQPGAAAGIAAASAGTQQMTSGTLRFADSNGISFGISNSSQLTASHNGLTTAALSDHSHSLNQILSPSADVFFSFSQGRQIQFQFSNTGTFTTNANKQALFEIDIQGNLVDGADAVHIHQSDNNPNIDLLHLEAWGTNVVPLRISASRSIAMEINKPIAFFGTAPNTASVPLILGVGQSNQVSFLNANYLQGKLSSEFQSTGAYLTTAMQSQSSSVFAKTGFTSTTTVGTAVVGTQNTNGLSLGVPLFLTTAQPVGAYLTTARASNDAVGLGTAQTNVVWTVNSAGISLNAGGYAGTSTGATNATVTLNSAGINISVAAPGGAGDGVNVIQLNTNGNTAGATSSQSSGTIYWAGGNNITLSQNSNSITISGANAGGAQTGISSIAGSNATYTSGMVIMSDQANITIGTSVNAGSQYLRFSVGNYITTARASNDAVGLNTAATNVTWTVNSSGISLNAGAYLTTAQPVGAYLTTAALSQDSSKYAGINGAITGGSITLNTSGVSINLPAYLTTAAQSGHSHAFATTTTNGASIIVGTTNSAGVTIGVPAYLTTAQAVGAYLTTARASNDAIGLNTAATSVTWTVNSSGISLNAGAYLTTAALVSHSHGNPTLNLTNLTGTTASGSAGFTLSLSANAPGAAAENNWFTLAGNVVGNSSASGSTILLSGGNNITLSGTNGSQIIISAGNGGGGGVAMGVSSGGHTAGNTGTYSSGTFVFQGSNSLTMEQSTGAGSVHTIHLRPAMSQLTAGNLISLSSNGSTISIIGLGAGTGTSATNASITMNTNGLAISVAAPGGGAGVTLSGFDGFANNEFLAIAGGNGTLWMDPLDLPCAVQFDRVGLRITGSNASNSSGSATISAYIGFYTRNDSTLSLLASTSFQTAITQSGTAGSYSLFGGIKILPIPWTTTISGGNYWLGIITRTSTAGTNMTFGNLANSQLASTMSGFFGSASNATNGIRLAEGVYSATTAALPAAISMTQINGNSSAFLRQPAYLFMSNIF